ncbi:hypothetical protein JC796_17645 [Delftia acidovorans]|uniref:hypothetical protein n=1 Tax=Delftia acidovorans TaxID=80866 RepID=UPI0018E7C759|nr:hypothetical protein [Delftia acidovorans]MBJ2142570.1 hypothetical protein [Delftia acidovorans]
MPEYAFPGLNAQFTGISSDGDERYEIAPSGGMLLRDHFAGLAMQAFLNGHVSHYGHENPWPYEAMASEAYDVADAMLRAREKEPSS